MYQLILLIHVFAAVFIIALVLVQQGKGVTMGAAFGSGASSTVFGSRGSGSFLFRVTISLVAVFFLTSIALNYMVMHAYKQEKGITLPVMPAAPAPATQQQAPATTAPETQQDNTVPATTNAPSTDQTTPATPGEIPTRK